MDQKIVAAALILVIAVATGATYVLTHQPQASSLSPIEYTYQIVKTYPHDPSAYTEGLLIDGGFLYESTGEIGTSSLRRVDLASGVVEQQADLGYSYYGEGLTLVGDRLIQLTWRNNIGFVYDKDTFALLGNFSYLTEGWGLTYDGSKLFMSDGTDTLYFLDPDTFQQIGKVSVHDDNATIENINELEYVNGDIYANIWQTEKIAIINPLNGGVKGWIDLSGLDQQKSYNDVLNGIAYDKQADRLFVTGKYWSSLFEIRIVPK